MQNYFRVIPTKRVWNIWKLLLSEFSDYQRGIITEVLKTWTDYCLKETNNVETIFCYFPPSTLISWQIYFILFQAVLAMSIIARGRWNVLRKLTFNAHVL